MASIAPFCSRGEGKSALRWTDRWGRMIINRNRCPIRPHRDFRFDQIYAISRCAIKADDECVSSKSSPLRDSSKEYIHIYIQLFHSQLRFPFDPAGAWSRVFEFGATEISISRSDHTSSLPHRRRSRSICGIALRSQYTFYCHRGSKQRWQRSG